MSPGSRSLGAAAGEHLARLRDARTGPAAFRRALAPVATLVCAEALRDLDAAPGTVATPLATASTLRTTRGLTLVPILRAGLAMLEPALALAPGEPRVGMLGMVRDERTLRASTYLERLPRGLAEDEVVVLDVMLATGGSAIAALDALAARGATRMRIAAVVAAPEGLAAVAAAHPGVPVTVAAVDERLDDRGFIVPGLGDAGDRLYGTGPA